MAEISVTNSPLLRSPAQLYLLPVTANATILDPVVNRCKLLFNDNYLKYSQACIDGLLPVGSSLLVQRRLEHMGLGVSTNSNQPIYIANLVVTDHATHPIRKRWLNQALDHILPELYNLIRYEGLRRISILARPLIARDPRENSKTPFISDDASSLVVSSDTLPANLSVPIMNWHKDIYPLLTSKLKRLPKVRIDIHVPKSIESTDDVF